MALWTNVDNDAGKPKYVENSESTSSSGDSGDITKVFGVDATEVHSGGDNVINIAIVDGGNKYRENQLVFAFDTSNTPSLGYAVANPTTGKLTNVVVVGTGNGFDVAPPIVTFGAHYTISTANFNTNNTITYTNHPLDTGDFVRYLRMGGTAATGKGPGVANGSINNNTFYVRKLTANTFKLYYTLAGATEGNGVSVLTPEAAVNTTADTINFSSPHGYTTGDEIYYNAGGGTKITLDTGDLSDSAPYYAVVVNSNDIKLATSRADAIATSPITVDITGTGNDAQFFTTSELDITGTGNNGQRIMLANDNDQHNTAADNKATFASTLGSGDDGDGGNLSSTVTHAGWVRRTVGTGGRAGRVFQETLVAMGSMSSDNSDDTKYPDA